MSRVATHPTELKSSVIHLKNLSLSFGKRTILKGINADFKAGELTILLGPNGTGKSSLLKLITQEYPSSGEIHFFGDHVKSWKSKSLAKHLGVLPQSSSLTFNFSVKEVVELGGIPLEGSTESIQAIARQNMTDTDVYHLAERSYPSLSGGEKQRVHFARVLTQLAQSNGKKILLLDEPTSALDLSHQHQTLRLATRLVSEGAAVIIVMHDLNLAAQYADRIMILNEGTIVADGSPWEVLTQENIEAIYNWKVQVIPHPTDQYPLVINTSSSCNHQ